MFEDETIGERFAKLRTNKKDKHGKEMPVIQLAQELAEKNFIKDYSIDVIRQEIGKVENKDKFPQLFLIKGYCDYFNVTSDYLLGLRKSKPVDENIAMISKTTGLSDISINMLKQYKDLHLDILNCLIESNALFELIKTIVIDAHDSFDNKKEGVLSYGEYIVLRKIEEIIEQIFMNETLRDKALKYQFERIKALYGNDPNEILKMPELPED